MNTAPLRRQSKIALLKDRAGSVSLIFAATVLILFSFVGAAVDYSRWSNVAGRTSDALDAALLSGARTLQTTQNLDDAIAVAEKAFLENAQSRLRLLKPKVEIKLSADGSSLEGSVTGKVKTPFLGLLRVGTLHVTTASRVGFSIGAGSASGGSDLEISLMLDVTGSMCNDGSGPCTSSTKLDALKTAASDLVNIIMKGSSPAGARIAVVPFSTRMVVGTPLDASANAFMKKLTDLPDKWTGWLEEGTGCSPWVPGATSEDPGTGGTCTGTTVTHKVNWDIVPCVTDRTGPEEFTDAAPGSNAWLNGQEGGRRALSWDSSDTPIADGAGTGKNPADPSGQWNYNNSGATCWDVDHANIIMPLTSDKDALLNRISSLVGYGSTSGALGTAWTWYMLSPNWAPVLPAASAPGAYTDTVAVGTNPPKLRKIAVLMTDGEYNTYRGWMGADKNMVAGNAKSICANMKAQGVEIYTVGFALDALAPADKARAVDILETCGTDLQHFYDALNAEQLKQSFRDIAMQLSQLYVAR